MISSLKNAPMSAAGFDPEVQEFQNALATLFNVHYLLELEASNADHVRRYLKLADPAMETLLRFSRGARESA
jgi:hypothetical protein